MSARVSRRWFLHTSAGAVAGLSLAALDHAPALRAEARADVPHLGTTSSRPSDDELRRQAEVFGKQAGVTVRVDTIAHLQLPAKRAAEAQSQSGHDLIVTGAADPFLYEQQLVDMGDLVDDPRQAVRRLVPLREGVRSDGVGLAGGALVLDLVPGHLQQAHFKKAGLEHAEDLGRAAPARARSSRSRATPSASRSATAPTPTSRSGRSLWCYGGKVLEADGKTPAINSDKTAQVIEWYKELYRDAMEPEVLSWDDASNNRFILSGKGSWIHNPISPYNAALTKKMPIADDINHHNEPGRPGRHPLRHRPSTGSASGSSPRTSPLAKEFVKFLFQKENYDAWIVGRAMPSTIRRCGTSPTTRSGPATRSSRCCPRRRSTCTILGAGRPSPTPRCSWIEVNYVLPDMSPRPCRHAHQARAWRGAQDQVRLAVQGKLKTEGKASHGHRPARRSRRAGLRAAPAASRASASGGSRSTSSATG